MERDGGDTAGTPDHNRRTEHYGNPYSVKVADDVAECHDEQSFRTMVRQLVEDNLDAGVDPARLKFPVGYLNGRFSITLCRIGLEQARVTLRERGIF